MPDKTIKEAAAATPDPERSFKNLQTFCSQNPGYTEQVVANIEPIAMLFSISQFLASFLSSEPDALFEAIGNIDKPLEKDAVSRSLRQTIMEMPKPSPETQMAVIRRFNKKMLALITLRDILERVGIIESTLELSILADAVVEQSLLIVREGMREIYGDPADDAFSVIAVGKLGGRELNFRSDIDLLYVYGREHGETSGIMKSSGIATNRVSNHEYYCKLGENLGKFLSINTEDGLAYRVDMRLRPEGQKGSLAMSLTAYEVYYESWGRAWERAALVRARHVAGDSDLGKSFVDMIKLFVYRKYLDFSAIDEIRGMKTRMDGAFKRDDIKRGYGGIREIEFFVHAMQLIYGGRDPILRQKDIMAGLFMLLQKNLIGREDYSSLSENYLFLRRLEHRLQQLNGLQTHSMPADREEVIALGRKMGFGTKIAFLSELEKRRRTTHQIYGSLFLEKGQVHKETPDIADGMAKDIALLFSEETTDSELRNAFRRHNLKNIEKALRNIHHIRDSTFAFQTLKGRMLLEQILPFFLSETLRSKDPDLALNNMESFAHLLASEEAYLELISKNKSLVPALVRVFSISEYLSKAIMKRPEYLELLGCGLFTKKTLQSLKEDIMREVSTGKPISDSIRTFRRSEEIMLGMLFLDKKIDVLTLMKGLSRVADAILSACVSEFDSDEKFAVVGMGKSGGRELTFSSDLDLIFVCEGDVAGRQIKAAEKLLRLLTYYTKDGISYNVDMRLRPDGAKGPLVSAIKPLTDYYLRSAQPWEIQALLKARPIAGDNKTCGGFALMREKILAEKGGVIPAGDIRSMRERIKKELSKEAGPRADAEDTGVYDIKLGSGGLEELEFTVQYLQLRNARHYGSLMVQGTLDAIRRLNACGVINDKTSDFMKGSYIFYRTIESLMRLINETVLRPHTATANAVSEFMGFSAVNAFLEELKEIKADVNRMFDAFVA